MNTYTTKNIVFVAFVGLVLMHPASGETFLWEFYAENFDVCLVRGELAVPKKDVGSRGRLVGTIGTADTKGQVEYAPRELRIDDVISGSSWLQRIVAHKGPRAMIDSFVKMVIVPKSEKVQEIKMAMVVDGDGIFLLGFNGPAFSPQCTVLERINQDQVRLFLEHRKTFLKQEQKLRKDSAISPNPAAEQGGRGDGDKPPN